MINVKSNKEINEYMALRFNKYKNNFNNGK